MERIKFISIENLMEMIENDDKFKLVEVLGEGNYKEGHLPHAINVPFENMKSGNFGNLKKTDTIVVYCASYHCPLSTNTAKFLLSKGFKKVMDFKAGKAGWVDAGLDLDK